MARVLFVAPEFKTAQPVSPFPHKQDVQFFCRPSKYTKMTGSVNNYFSRFQGFEEDP